MAILAGLIANTLVYTWSLGPVAPFDAAAAALVLGGIPIALMWTENYGNAKQQQGLDHTFKAAAAAIMGGARARAADAPSHRARVPLPTLCPLDSARRPVCCARRPAHRPAGRHAVAL